MIKKSLSRFLLSLVVIAILGTTLHELAQTKTSGTASVIPAPLVDHHQHLFSAARAKAIYPPPLPEIKLPDELARLIRERSRTFNDKTALAELYRDDSLLLNTQDGEFPTWMTGGSAVALELTRYFNDPYRITPVAYRIDGNAGYIAGYLTRGEGEATKHFAHVLLSIAKNENGTWSILTESPTIPGPFSRDPVSAEQLIALLDNAGIQRAVVLSVAYQWDNRNSKDPNAYEKVRTENDYTAREVAKFPNRLVGFCGVNPLKDYAIKELERCTNELHLKGLKMQFGNSGVDLRKPEHLEKVRRVFRAANRLRTPIVAHLWINPEFEKEGGQHAKVFLEQLLPEVPDITVQIAHMAGGGRSTDTALAVFADAIAAKNPLTKNLYFDVSTLTVGQSKAGLQKDAERMRQIGLERILYGTDASPTNPPYVSWGSFKGLMPLTDAEFRIVASNIAPYLR